MITDLAVADFQSLRDVELHLGPLTVIVGAGNVGKTAAVRALRALALNRSGGDFIRHGQSACAVVVTTDDGHAISWVKESGTAKYEVDGQELTKLGKAVPEVVSDALGIRRIEVEQSSYAFPQVHSQFDSPFLLDESPSKAARVIAKLTRLDVIVSAEVAAARDLKRASSKLKEDGAALELATEEHTALAHRAKVAEKHAQEVEALYDEVCGRESRVEQAEEALEAMATAALVLERRVPSSAEVHELEGLLHQYEEVGKVYGHWDTCVLQVSTAKEASAEASSKLVRVEMELAKFDTCPLCGAKMGD